jgi:SAM-dependent methyltransferase
LDQSGEVREPADLDSGTGAGPSPLNGLPRPWPEAALQYRQERQRHWSNYVRKPAGGPYHRRLVEIYRFLIRPRSRVLELGCGTGDLLAALEPAVGVGVDFSAPILQHARSHHPQLRFVECDAHELDLNERFDYIILSDLVNELWDVQAVIERLASVCTSSTRVIINTYSRLWEVPLAMARRLGLANPVLGQNWLTREDLDNMLALGGFEVIRQWQEVLCPTHIPLLEPLCNRYLVKLWPLRYLALTNLIVARPAPEPVTRAVSPQPLVSVIVPARNEAGNVEELVRRVPEMGAGTEIVFVEGHSRDDTYAEIQRAITRHPERRIKLLRQGGTGKGDAVRAGFGEAQGQILMILDADMTVAPEDLPRFYDALRSRRGEFINGVRFVYPMEKQAMRPLNFLGNKFFSLVFSWLLGQSVKDTLCGTKVLSRSDYETVADNRYYFGDFDPFGDFDLLFGAARLDLKIVDMPVRYHERTYGQTNIQRWRHGLLLLRMAAFALSRLKFV